MATRTELEQSLLQNPFDKGLRTDYALLLLQGSEAQAALTQYSCCASRAATRRCPHRCRPGTAAARPSSRALSRYASARRMDGFEPGELDRLESQARRSAAAAAVAGDHAMNVIPISAPGGEVRFSSIVGMEDLKKMIRIKIIEPFLNPGLFQKFRKQAGGGILLYGPPGCGRR